jgi:hypothetical protein
VRCHLGVGPQERTAEEHTTRGVPTTRGIFGRGISGGTVSRGWSLSTVLCGGGMYPAQTLTTSGSRQRSSMSCSPELTADRRGRGSRLLEVHTFFRTRPHAKADFGVSSCIRGLVRKNG